VVGWVQVNEITRLREIEGAAEVASQKGDSLDRLTDCLQIAVIADGRVSMAAKRHIELAAPVDPTKTIVADAIEKASSAFHRAALRVTGLAVPTAHFVEIRRILLVGFVALELGNKPLYLGLSHAVAVD
jgi:hypothetical protein